jgi:hypothetical protein
MICGCTNNLATRAQRVQIQLFMVSNLRSFVSNFAVVCARQLSVKFDWLGLILDFAVVIA